MSLLQAFKGHRGEYLVALQFLLFFAFVLAPNWNPLATTEVLAALAPVRWIALGGAGLVALVFGGFGVLHIRDYLTPLPYPVDHNQLVKHGIYAWVRHPLYSSQLFAALGWTLYTLSLTHLLILILGFVFFDYKARKEEDWLTERHPEYAEYARQVRKFVPWIY
ncbi:methyltransferase family protein [Thermochromatium tepidum]|uniref:Isoprenylcysteine carboxylmethyltransferase family protein n=1 Tax=Thermochromatium tepidum ATCC 43061 TaxID=316276 RepID=A0A6I6EDD4_THETI|nr:isoprenylcysteine carboxylmethyltransferase family protein [Thermochromatium tepidum]QGU32969.1 isoprenylcysteine carboxylmethyltransferase family protein [Thermochromatium tepidum ATCC 43061]